MIAVNFFRLLWSAWLLFRSIVALARADQSPTQIGAEVLARAAVPELLERGKRVAFTQGTRPGGQPVVAVLAIDGRATELAEWFERIKGES